MEDLERGTDVLAGLPTLPCPSLDLATSEQCSGAFEGHVQCVAEEFLGSIEVPECIVELSPRGSHEATTAPAHGEDPRYGHPLRRLIEAVVQHPFCEVDLSR